MLRVFFVFCTAITCSLPVRLYAADIRLTEISVTPYGSVNHLTFSINNYEIAINDRGKITGISVYSLSNNEFEINYYPSMIKTNGTNSSDLYYRDTLIDRIGDIEFRYSQQQTYTRIHEIANIEFEYYSTSAMEFRVKEIHNLAGWDKLEFIYTNNSGKIKHIGNTMFSYESGDKRITGFEKRFFDEEYPAVRIAIENPLDAALK